MLSRLLTNDSDKSSLVGDRGSVYAIEAEPENCKLLRKNLDLNGFDNVMIAERAVTNNTGTTEFYLSGMDNGSHSLNSEAARGVHTQLSVVTTTLDDFLATRNWPNVDLLKIDVEGAELSVIQGMTTFFTKYQSAKLLLEYCPYLLVAHGVNPEELLKIVHSKGYCIKFVDDVNRETILSDYSFKLITEKLLKEEAFVNILCER